MLRVVLDTNVFVSGLLTKAGLPAKVLDAWRAGKYLLVISPSIIAEVQAVLEAPEISKKYSIVSEDIDRLINLFEKDALVVPGHSNIKETVLKDPSDEMFLACALDARADYIVSGDRHLLNLKEFRGIPIITVRDFADRLGEEVIA